MNKNISWPWFIFGSLLSAAGFFLTFWAFALSEITASQKALLLFVLPLVAGFACGCFSGSIKGQGAFVNFTVAATGGFAVWLMSYSMLVRGFDLPAQHALEIRGFQFLDSGELQVDGPNRTMRSLKPVTRNSFDFDRIEDFKVPFAFCVFGVKREGSDINLEVSIQICDAHGNVLYSDTAQHYYKFGQWRNQPGAKKLGPQKVLAFFDLDEDQVQNDGVIPFHLLISELALEQLPRGRGILRICASDNFQHVHRVYEQPFGVTVATKNSLTAHVQ
jgi:hypothetical protein